jgi:hypothetical protein
MVPSRLLVCSGSPTIELSKMTGLGTAWWVLGALSNDPCSFYLFGDI